MYVCTYARSFGFFRKEQNKGIRPIGRNYIDGRKVRAETNEFEIKRQRVTGSPISEKSPRLSLRVALARVPRFVFQGDSRNVPIMVRRARHILFLSFIGKTIAIASLLPLSRS